MRSWIISTISVRARSRLRSSSKKLMVKDHGIGIEADKLDYIFNRFYRADESRAQNNNNFGLGLAIAKRICSYYDYAITVESIVDQYTIFTIDFERR